MTTTPWHSDGADEVAEEKQGRNEAANHHRCAESHMTRVSAHCPSVTPSLAVHHLAHSLCCDKRFSAFLSPGPISLRHYIHVPKLTAGASGSPPSAWFSFRSLARIESLTPPDFDDFALLAAAAAASASSATSETFVSSSAIIRRPRPCTGRRALRTAGPFTPIGAHVIQAQGELCRCACRLCSRKTAVSGYPRLMKTRSNTQRGH